MKIIFFTVIFLLSFVPDIYGQGPPPAPPPPSTVIITEIMYNSPEEMDSLNFIEIQFIGWYSTSDTFRLDSFRFSDNIDFQFHDTLIPSAPYLLLVQDSVAFESVYGITAFQWGEGTDLSPNQPISISGYTHWGDTVEFDTISPWLTPTNGNGYSLTRCSEQSSLSFESSSHNSGIEINGVIVFADPNTHVWNSCATVAIPETPPSSGLKLYPNPNSGIFTLDYHQLQQNATLRIRNTLGQILFERLLDKGSTTLTQNIKFNKGIYLLELDDDTDHQHQYMVITD